MASLVKRLYPSISAHSWNADGTKVAISPNNNEIHIYAKNGNNYVLEHKLAEHDQLVTGIDWAPKTNRIVSCSQDRNAYVWTFNDKEKKWKPVLVILRLNRAATWVKWSPLENKFAVASGQKCVAVCFFEEDQDWWVSKHIKKHKSTVLKVDWHPNNILLATASTDFRARVFSAFVKGVDKSPAENVFGKINTFGDVLCELDQVSGWVQSVKWSPSGNLLAFIGHDASFAVADFSSSAQPSTSVVKYTSLPFLDILWVSEDSVVAVGHDCTPVLFQKKGAAWAFVKKIDEGKTSSSAAKGPNAFDVFKSKVDKGQEAPQETSLVTNHQNCITVVTPIKSQGGKVSQYGTSGVDGNLIVWDAKF